MIARAALACASVLTVAGCGTAADSDQARAATERFYAAVRQGDGRSACAELSQATRSQLVKDEKQPDCAKAVLKLSLHGTRVGSVEVYATSAVAKLVGGDTVFLGDTKNGWRLEAVGCKPAGSGPLDCEEQA